MEREIQVISRGALGNAMQPGQCPRRPPPALCKMGNFWREGGMGAERLQLPPASPRGAKRPSPAPVVLPVGLWGGCEPSCPQIGCVSVGARGWQAPAPRGNVPPVGAGTVLGLAPPRWAPDRGTSVTQ